MASLVNAPVNGIRPQGRQWTYVLDNEKVLGLVMISPAILYVLALVGYPLVLAILYSLSDITIGSAQYHFVGLQKFKTLIGTPEFRTALKNTLLFTLVSQVIVMVLANILAQLLLRDFKGKFYIRALILMPYVAPISLGVIGWLWMLDSIYSPINWVLQHSGLFGKDFWPMWLGKPSLAMISIITVHVWRMLPLATVIILAGLSSIPLDIKDAALVDGAGYFRTLFQITLPMMLPIMLGGRPVRHRLFVYRYHHHPGPDPGRSLRLHPGPGQPGLFYGHRRRRPGRGGRLRPLPFSPSGGRGHFYAADRPTFGGSLRWNTTRKGLNGGP